MSKANPRISIHLTLAVISIIALSACSRTQFRSVAQEADKTFVAEPPIEIPIEEPAPPAEPPPPIVIPPVEPPPAEPPPVVIPPPPVEPPPVEPPPPVVIPQPVQKNGACLPNSSTQLLTCMNCIVPMNPPAPPQFSEKGQAFIDIMTIGCSVPNKSAPKGYTPPTRAELIDRLNRLSPNLYPDTSMSSGQKNIVAGLRTDSKWQQKIFGGLYYQPPYSDYLETYFGVSTSEAVQSLCYSDSGYTPTSALPLMSKEYLDCTYESSSCREKPEYIKANRYRDQLNQAMKESVRNPYVAPPPTPSKNCKWESFEGDFDLGGEAVLARWLVSHFKVGIEIGTLGGKCEMITAMPTGANQLRGEVKMAGYICK